MNKPRKVKLQRDYSFENTYGEIISIKKGEIFTLIESGAYTPETNSNVLWKCGKGKSDFTILSIPKCFLRDFDETLTNRIISQKRQK